MIIITINDNTIIVLFVLLSYYYLMTPLSLGRPELAGHPVRLHLDSAAAPAVHVAMVQISQALVQILVPIFSPIQPLVLYNLKSYTTFSSNLPNPRRPACELPYRVSGVPWASPKIIRSVFRLPQRCTRRGAHGVHKML